MTIASTPKYLFLDLETTGLDPRRDRILECAAIVADEELRQIWDPFSQVLAFVYAPALLPIDPYVLDMHTQNGLFEECGRTGYDVADLTEELHDLIDGIAWADDKPILAGSSVHFDRGFLREKMPGFEARLHHRHLDITAIKLAAGATFSKDEVGPDKHRALLDVATTLKNMREWQRLIRGARAAHDNLIDEVS